MSEAQGLVRETFLGGFSQPGEFSIRSFVRAKGGHAAFIEYDIEKGYVLKPIYRTIIDLAIKEALSRHRSEGNVYFVMDEFALLPQLAHVENGINFGRSLNLKFLVAVQNVGQVLEAYGEAAGWSILSGFGTIISFRLFDKTSREFVRDRYGMNLKHYHVQGPNQLEKPFQELRDGHVIEDWEMSELPVGKAILCLPHEPPWFFSFLPFEPDGHLRTTTPPVQGSALRQVPR